MTLDARRRRTTHLAIALVVACAPSVAAAGQDGMPPIPAERLTDAQRSAIAAFKAARGTELSTAFVPLLRSPELMTRARAMGDYLRFKSALPPKLSEFVILIVARQWTQQYEWNTHYPLALKAGLDPGIARAIAEARRPDAMTDDEEVLYGFVSSSTGTEASATPPMARRSRDSAKPASSTRSGSWGITRFSRWP